MLGIKKRIERRRREREEMSKLLRHLILDDINIKNLVADTIHAEHIKTVDLRVTQDVNGGC